MRAGSLAGGACRGERPDAADLLAIRLIWEEALLAHVPGIAGNMAGNRRRSCCTGRPVGQPDVALAILQDAADRAHQRGLIADLDGESGKAPAGASGCLLHRCPFRGVPAGAGERRSNIETIGFAGFFGLPIAHKAHGSDVVEAHLPVL
jgi:hypothetical protein